MSSDTISTSTPFSLTVEGVSAQAPRGLDFVSESRPRLSWRSATDALDWTQSSAELELTAGTGTERATVDGAASVLVDWPFSPLAPRDDTSLRVRVTGADGTRSDWSEPLRIRAGFLADGEWTAQPIGLTDPAELAQPGLVRREFEVSGEVVSAILYATALGVYQASLNGSDVDDQVLKPGWTPYERRVIHETTDVTDLLTPRSNALGIRFAGGWATELFGFRGNATPIYTDQPLVAAQLVITYADGRTESVVTDESWRGSAGPVTASGIYPGEDHDVRLEQPGWDRPGFDDASWAPVRVGEGIATPSARTSPAVRRIDQLSAREVITTPSGKAVLDFGQNLVGRLRITVDGPADTVITMRHAEVLEHDELGTRPLRAARATNTLTLAGTGPITWEPEFTFQGFRYAEISGWPGELDPSAITAQVIHSDMERTGWFTSSHDLVNRLHENVVWGLRGNFLYVPTDCPQRDERLGWTGDIQVFTPTASFLYDVRGFLSSWLVDLEIEQTANDGVVPFVVPNVLRGRVRPAAAWGDAATVVPTVLHERFADRRVLADQLASMQAWTDVIVDRSGVRNLWEGQFQFADWLDPSAPPERPADAKTHPDIVATAYVFRSADLTAQAATLLGQAEVAEKYRKIAEVVREAFLAEYVTPAGRIMSDAQTGYALAIMFDIAPPDQQQALGDRLAELVRSGGYTIGTGFVGTPIVCDALTRTGHLDTATRLLTQTACPSWLYPVTMGATTIWERWDSMLPDGTINPGEMTSFNHYALGAVADWLHRVVAGLAPAAPGYAQLRIEPKPLAGFDFAEASHITPYGLASVRWQRSGDTITVRAVVPPNTTADVRLPDGQQLAVGSGRYEWSVTAAVEVPEAGLVSLQSTLADLIDDPEAYGAFFAVIEGADRAAADDLRRHTAWLPGRRVNELFDHAAPRSAQDQVAEAFEELNTRRAG
ncbi:MAG TPA: family 78 glycoside hydrolase catalytic domain [Microlunatus sp.]|nr:family 78 glycoside hydrolase catalytic domain [Microlunatus sp.]